MILESVALQHIKPLPVVFPFTVPVIQHLDTLHFSTHVTFFVGENGSGKSTLLEAIASAVGSVTVGSDSVETDSTLHAVRQLGQALKLVWTTKRTRRGFFMRSEDFFGYARRMAQVRQQLEQDLQDVETEYQDRSDYARGLARMPHMRELTELQRLYGESLDAQSHGESYFKLFQSRFVPDGLYLLDEPEAPLSPIRQLALLRMLKQMTTQGGQFIIATHSPIILAYPNATIYSFDDGHITSVDYESLEHVTLTRAFLNDPQQYLQHLL